MIKSIIYQESWFHDFPKKISEIIGGIKYVKLKPYHERYAKGIICFCDVT